MPTQAFPFFIACHFIVLKRRYPSVSCILTANIISLRVFCLLHNTALDTIRSRAVKDDYTSYI